MQWQHCKPLLLGDVVPWRVLGLSTACLSDPAPSMALGEVRLYIRNSYEKAVPIHVHHAVQSKISTREPPDRAEAGKEFPLNISHQKYEDTS